MSRPATLVAVAVTALVVPAARGATPGDPPAYSVAVALVVAPSALDARYITGTVTGLPPTLGAPVVPVGRQVRDAYAAAMRQMFSGSGMTPSAQLAPSVSGSGIDLGPRGWYAYVEHDIVLRPVAPGLEIARWHVRGEAAIEGLGEDAIPGAFAAAAASAARAFEAEFERPPAVAEWLTGLGVPRRGSPAAPAQSATFSGWPTGPAVPPRADALLFAELGGAAVGGAGWLSSGVAARGGWSGRAWLVQAAIDASPRAFVARPSTAWGEARGSALVLSVGVDVGLQRRLTPRFEIAGGLGAALVTARASATLLPLVSPTTPTDVSQGASTVAGSAFAAATLNGTLIGLGSRYRAGIEIRQSLGARLQLEALGSSVPVSALSATIFFGFER